MDQADPKPQNASVMCLHAFIFILNRLKCNLLSTAYEFIGLGQSDMLRTLNRLTCPWGDLGSIVGQGLTVHHGKLSADRGMCGSRARSRTISTENAPSSRAVEGKEGKLILAMKTSLQIARERLPPHNVRPSKEGCCSDSNFSLGMQVVRLFRQHHVQTHNVEYESL